MRRRLHSTFINTLYCGRNVDVTSRLGIEFHRDYMSVTASQMTCLTSSSFQNLRRLKSRKVTLLALSVFDCDFEPAVRLPLDVDRIT